MSRHGSKKKHTKRYSYIFASVETDVTGANGTQEGRIAIVNPFDGAGLATMADAALNRVRHLDKKVSVLCTTAHTLSGTYIDGGLNGGKEGGGQEDSGCEGADGVHGE